MASDNTVTLVGNLTDDPEMRYTPSGQQVTNFTVAVNRRIRNQDGTWDDRLDGFFRCSCWRDLAEHVAESLTKGARVVVVGRLQQRSWEDSDGNKRSAFEVQVDEVGPSLRWATARVEKSQRSGSSSGSSDSSGGGDWGAAPATVGTQGAPASSGGQKPQQDQGADW